MTMSIRSARALPRLPVAGLCIALLALAGCGHDAASATEAATTPTPAATPAEAAPATAPAANAPAAQPDASSASGASALIGLVVPPYPDGLTEIAGSCVPSGPGNDRLCDFGISMLGDAAKGSSAAMARFVTAARHADPGADGKPRWEVLDAVDVPRLPPGYDLQLGACKFDGKDAPGLIAVVRHGTGDTSVDVKWVRRFDTDGGKLVDADTTKVSCADPAAGL
ncbi:MAG: hypothetical protein ACTHOH_00620 [Lysobacteraceae bacterium]